MPIVNGMKSSKHVQTGACTYALALERRIDERDGCARSRVAARS